MPLSYYAVVENLIVKNPYRAAELCVHLAIDPITLSDALVRRFPDQCAALLAHYDRLTGRK